jgi:hypothetical protein
MILATRHQIRKCNTTFKMRKITWLFTFHIEVEEEVCLSSNAGHVVNEVRQCNVVLEYNIQRK